MRTLILTLATLSLLLLAAHFLRYGEWGLCSAIVGLNALTFYRLAWVRWIVIAVLALGIMVWVDTGMTLINMRMAFDQPWVRLSLIIGSVTILTAAVGSMRSLSLPIDVPLNFDFTIDHRVLIFSLLLGIAASLVFGLAPALEASNPSPATSLKEGIDQRGRRRGGAGRLRSILVVAQIAGSLVFVAGAGLFVRSLGGALELDLGLNPDGVVMMTRSIDREEFSPEAGSQFLRDVESRLEARPEVREAVVARAVELTLATAVSGPVAVWTEQMLAEGAESLDIYHNAVGPGYFELLEIPLLRGRPIMIGDVDGSLPVAVINQTMAERLWPEQDPIGRRFTMHLQDDAANIRGASEMTMEVVGLARDGLYLEIDEDPTPYFWASIYQTWAPIVTFLAGGVSVEEGVRALQQEVPIPADQLVLASPSSLRSQINIQVLHLRIASRVLGWGGLLGLLLAVIGIYGLVAFTVSLRTREMAIRMALGAHRAQIVGEVLAGGLRLTLVGLAIGAVIVVPLSFAVRSQLYGMSPLDPAALGGSVGVLFVAALAASLVPARRAAQNHPMQTLRTE